MIARLHLMHLNSKHLCNAPDCSEPGCVAELAADEIERLRRELAECERATALAQAEYERAVALAFCRAFNRK
jgi:hypothetical protein